MRVPAIIKAIAVPTPFQAAVSVTLGLLILFFLQRKVMIAALASLTGTTQDYLASSSTQQLEVITKVPYIDEVGVVLFWGLAGLAFYALTLVTVNSITNMRNFAMIQATYNAKPNPLDILLIAVTRFMLGVVVILVAIAAYFMLVPWLSGIWANAFTHHGSLIPRILEAIGSVVGVGVTLYVIWMLAMTSVVVRPTLQRHSTEIS